MKTGIPNGVPVFCSISGWTCISCSEVIRWDIGWITGRWTGQCGRIAAVRQGGRCSAQCFFSVFLWQCAVSGQRDGRFYSKFCFPGIGQIWKRGFLPFRRRLNRGIPGFPAPKPSAGRFCMQVSVEFSALLMGALLLLLVPLNWLSAAFFAAVIHEAAHAAVICFCGGRIYGLRIGASGARLDVGPLGVVQELLCAAAGPVGSFLLLILATRFPRLAICGFVQGCFNCLPVLPMDGGRVLRCLLLFLMPERGERVFRFLQKVVILIILPGVAILFFRKIPGILLSFAMILLIRLWVHRKIPCKQPQIGVQ